MIDKTTSKSMTVNERKQKQRRAKWQGELMMGISFAMLIFMCLTINL